MSIDIYTVENGKPIKHLLSINDREYAELYPAVEAFRKATGLFIDQYADLKLGNNVHGLLAILEVAPEQTAIYTKLIQVLRTLDKTGQSITFFGD